MFSFLRSFNLVPQYLEFFSFMFDYILLFQVSLLADNILLSHEILLKASAKVWGKRHTQPRFFLYESLLCSKK